MSTPKNIKSDNLEPPRKGPRGPIMVPLGTQRLTIPGKVLSSDLEPIIGELEQVIDGDKDIEEMGKIIFGPLSNLIKNLLA